MGYKDHRDEQLMALLEEGKTYQDIAKLAGTTVQAMKVMVRKKNPDLYERKKGRQGRRPDPAKAAAPAAQHEQSKQRAAEVAKRQQAMVDYLLADNDRTLQDVAEHFGVSREYVRQQVQKRAPGMYERRKQAKREESRRRQLTPRQRMMEDNPEAFPCRVCGTPLPTGRTAFCCDEHYKVWFGLRYHLDPKMRQTHKKAVAAWAARNPERVSEYHVRHAEKVLNDEEMAYRGRWLIQGSQNMERAIYLYENDYPMFKELPEEIQEQVRVVAEGRAVAAELEDDLDAPE